MKHNELIVKVTVRYNNDVAADREALAELLSDALVEAAENRELTDVVDPDLRIVDLGIDFKNPVKLTHAFGDDGI